MWLVKFVYYDGSPGMRKEDDGLYYSREIRWGGTPDKSKAARLTHKSAEKIREHNLRQPRIGIKSVVIPAE